MQKAQDDLRRLFEDVRSYAAELRFQPVVCDLRDCWREAWTDLAAAPGRQAAELYEDVGVNVPFCYADPFYLRQVFRNLLENALASGADPVRVVVRVRPATLDGRPAVVVAVRDNGPGFPAADRHRLFEPFYTTKLRGTGLGLGICKRIVEAHGGRIETGGRPGEGAEVCVTLPSAGGGEIDE
jgi:signal transduction histidine kinase